jgi:hypothetical protein
MPSIDEMRTATGYDYAEDLPPDVAAVVQLPEDQQPPSLMRVGGVELATWLQDNGWWTLFKYLTTHPRDTFAHATELSDTTLNPSNGDFLPLKNGPMIPWVFALTWQMWSFIFAACCGLLAIQRSTRQYGKTLLAMFLTALLVYIVTVHTSGIEHVRHSSTVAVIIRVLGFASLLAMLPKKSLNQILDEDVE